MKRNGMRKSLKLEAGSEEEEEEVNDPDKVGYFSHCCGTEYFAWVLVTLHQSPLTGTNFSIL